MSIEYVFVEKKSKAVWLRPICMIYVMTVHQSPLKQ
jgi:hypothetical protein